MLKVNTTLTYLDLSGELCLIQLVFPFIRILDILNDCVCCNTDIEIGDDGVRAIAEALKKNTTLVKINLLSE